jgi:hypothetical protein
MSMSDDDPTDITQAQLASNRRGCLKLVMLEDGFFNVR